MGARDGIHQDGKRFHGTWLFDEQWEKAQAAAAALGMRFGDMIKGIADGTLKVIRART